MRQKQAVRLSARVDQLVCSDKLENPAYRVIDRCFLHNDGRLTGNTTSSDGRKVRVTFNEKKRIWTYAS